MTRTNPRRRVRRLLPLPLMDVGQNLKPGEREAEVDADEFLVTKKSNADEVDHTPEGWVPRNQRPGYVSDYRRETRTIFGLTGQDQ